MPARAEGRRRGRRQGYSLVELAIVLAVLGMLLSAAVLPLGRQLEDKAYDRAFRHVNDAIDAIVGYAASRRSPGMNVLYLNLSGNTGINDNFRFYGHRIARVPEGRPYLPCPDVNGDGLEDRSAVYVPMEPAPGGLRPGSDDRFAYRGGSNRRRAVLAEDFDDGSNAGNAGKHAFGVCEQVRGDLPWATLGLPPTDSWGSALTYVVSPVFSTAAYGFDQGTRAGAFVPFYETAAVGAHQPAPLRSFAQRADRRLGAAPMIVCRPEDLYPAPGSDPLGCRPEDSIVDSTLHSNEDPVGQYADDHARYVADFLLNPEVRDVTDGLPFVIISHGPNKFGAASYDGTNRSCVGYPAPDMPPFAAGTIEVEEVNALFGSCYPYADVVQNEDPADRITNHSTRSFEIRDGLDRPYNYVFATTRVPIHEWEPRPAPLRGVVVGRRVFDFDDLVGWLTRRELGQRMRDAGVFPLSETFDGLYSGQALFPRPPS